MVNFIRDSLKKINPLVTLYRKINLFKEVSLKDYVNIMKLGLILKVKPNYTMASYRALSNIYELAKLAEKNNIEGCFVECGVWRGGCAVMMAKIIRKFRSKRKIWLFDSFEGLPEPTPNDGQMAKEIIGDKNMKGSLNSAGICIASRLDVIHLLSGLKLYTDNIIIVEGWFQATLPKLKNKIGHIAILRLDCDWYESTKCCLENLYHNVICGGYIVIDDYGYWPGCKKATDEFLRKEGLNNAILKQVDSNCFYFQKPQS